MPRKARQEIISPNSLYHVVSRGNNQRRIFRSTRDYKKLLKIIQEAKETYPFYLYAYSFLPNHYHLAIETKEITISKIMHKINTSYVKYFHRRYKSSGHLFQERFFSSLIDKDSYLWEVGRYIDLNSFRAGLVKKPEDYRWGSYLVYFQQNYKEDFIDRERFLDYLGEDFEKSRISYLDFVKEGLGVEEEPIFPFNIKMV